MSISETTEFQRRVYAAVKQIPCGRVTSYRDVAAAIGCRSCQAVGQALRRNPFAPVVPCHRVIAADGSLGGFSGARSGPELQRKRQLLAGEGVRFAAAGRLADPELRWEFHRNTLHPVQDEEPRMKTDEPPAKPQRSKPCRQAMFRH